MAKNSGVAKTDTAVKLVLLFFISLLSFSVGTYVGKQFSDDEARRAALEVDYNSHGGSNEHMETAKVHDESLQPIADEEVESLTEEYLRKEREVASETHTSGQSEHTSDKKEDTSGYTHRSKMKANDHEAAIAEKDSHQAHQAAAHTTETSEHNNNEARAATHVQVSAPHASATANSSHQENKEKHGFSANRVEEKMRKAAERVAQDMAPEKDYVKPREPSAVLPTVATTAIGKYTVQVASYMGEKEAKEHASQLMSKGYSAFYVPAEIKGRTWYRVSVGLFSDQKSAASFRAELLANQMATTAIVQKIVK